MKKLFKKGHLIISAIVVMLTALMYGFNPSKILPLFFDFKVEVTELKNIFRAIMGVYLGFATYWIIGVVKPNHWKNAVITNVIFMGGLAFGRIISTVFDGVSPQYVFALMLELIFMIWGIYNLKNKNIL